MDVHMGQICTAPTRVIAERAIYDELVDKLAAVARGVKVRDPLEADAHPGPVITSVHQERVEGIDEVVALHDEVAVRLADLRHIRACRDLIAARQRWRRLCKTCPVIRLSVFYPATDGGKFDHDY
jgi:hypothetical protein